MIRRITFLCFFATAQCAYPMFKLEKQSSFSQELYHAVITKSYLPRIPRLCDSLSDEVLDARDEDGKTVLGYAIEKGEAPAVGMLLVGGANSNKKTHGRSPLLLAVQTGRYELVPQLCMFKATDDAYELFHSAIKVKSPETIRALALSGFNVNVSTGDSSLLIEAVRSGDKELVRALLDHGAQKDKACLNLGAKEDESDNQEYYTAITLVQELLENHKACLRNQKQKQFEQRIIEDTQDLVIAYDEIMMLLEEHEIRRPNCKQQQSVQDLSCAIQ